MMPKSIDLSQDFLTRYRLNVKTVRKGCRSADEHPAPLDFLKRAALKRDVEARLLLVIFHEIGLSELDETTVNEYYQQVAHTGSPAARYAYARYLTLSKRRSDDAIEWLCKSAKEGFLPAKRSLGILYLWRDQPRQAFDWLNSAAEEGCCDSMMLLVSHGLDARDLEQAKVLKRWLETAAEAHHPIACQNMGIFCYQGAYDPPNPNTALHWFRLAAPFESSAAIAAALILENDLPEAALHPDEALDFWKMAAEAGQPDAMIMLAECYDRGYRVARDPDIAEKWRKKADKHSPGLPRTEESMTPETISAILKQVYLGSTVGVEIGPVFDKDPAQRLLLSGLLGDQDITAINVWLDRLIAQLPSRQSKFLRLRDPERANDSTNPVDRVERAAEAGEVDAQYCHGRRRLQEGASDDGLAWLELAARSSSPARFFLAGLYRHGMGSLSADENLARAWLEKAACNNFRPAQYHLAQIKLSEGLPSEAFLLFREIAVESNDMAQHHHRLWCQAYFGISSPDQMEALEAFAVNRAQTGNLQAKLDLGLLYEQLGEAVGERPDEKARQYYAMAAAAYKLADTHMTAQFRLGMLYLNGLGVEKNPALAFDYIRRASRNWSEIRDSEQERIPYLELPYQLALLYETGIGTAASSSMALNWYHRAARAFIIKTLDPRDDFWGNKEALFSDDPFRHR